jgi:hypothetical protein
MSRADEPVYEVLSPEGESRATTVAPTTAVADLRRAVVAQVWDFMFRGDEIFVLIRRALTERHPGIRFVDYAEFGDIHGPEQDALTAELPDRLRRHRCNAAVIGVGA